VVTIGGSKPADVNTGFTNETPNANYTGFGGNGSTTGTFGGLTTATDRERAAIRQHKSYDVVRQAWWRREGDRHHNQR